MTVRNVVFENIDPPAHSGGHREREDSYSYERDRGKLYTYI